MSNPQRSTASVVLTALGIAGCACLGLLVLGFVALWLLLSHMGPIG